MFSNILERRVFVMFYLKVKFRNIIIVLQLQHSRGCVFGLRIIIFLVTLLHVVVWGAFQPKEGWTIEFVVLAIQAFYSISIFIVHKFNS